MSRTRVSLDAGELRRMYVDERLTQRQIANALGVSRQVVGRRLADLGIEAPDGLAVEVICYRFPSALVRRITASSSTSASSLSAASATRLTLHCCGSATWTFCASRTLIRRLLAMGRR